MPNRSCILTGEPSEGQRLQKTSLDFKKTSFNFAVKNISLTNSLLKASGMYERLLKQTERYLENKRGVAVAVKQLWDAMVKEGTKSSFAVPSLMADFECLLEGDNRFEFVAERSHRSGSNPDLEELLEHDELEKLGFLSSQKVKLRRVASPSLESEEESHDALDAAVSIEDLGDNFPDSALFDEDATPTVRGRAGTFPPAKKESGSAGGEGRPSRKKSAKPEKNVAKKKPSAKKGKK